METLSKLRKTKKNLGGDSTRFKSEKPINVKVRFSKINNGELSFLSRNSAKIFGDKFS